MSNLDILYNKFGIDGIGTGRGLPYIDAPRGHHAEICVFYRSRNKLKEINIKKIEDLNVSQNSRALEMKNKRRENMRRKREERKKYFEKIKENKKENKKRNLFLEENDDDSMDNNFKKRNLDSIFSQTEIEDIL